MENVATRSLIVPSILLSQSFPIMDAPVNHLKAERLVNTLRLVVIEPRVRCHLDASVTTGPVFRRGQELCADTFPPVEFRDEPPFDESDGNACVAAVGMRTQAHLHKAN
jgi:hypothetical protein